MAMPVRRVARRATLPRRRRRSPADAWIAQLVHDLRNPLGIVESFAEILPTAAPAERAEMCDRLRVNARRALHVLEEFALLADLRHGSSGPPQLERWDAVELARELIGEIEAAERRPARVRVRGEERLAVRASRPQLASALRALLRDALRATAPDGSVDLALHAGHRAAFRLIATVGRGDVERSPGRLRIDRISLELARRVAAQHGGRLTVTRRRRATAIALALPASR